MEIIQCPAAGNMWWNKLQYFCCMNGASFLPKFSVEYNNCGSFGMNDGMIQHESTNSD